MNLIVSVIIPAYNVEKYIDRCIRSVVEQDYHNLEMLIIDDGSTDDTLKVSQKWQELDKRIKVITQSNIGLGRTRNRGVDLCEGDYVLFLDADDWLEEEAICTLVNNAKKNCSDIVLFDYYNIWNADSPFDIRREIVKIPLRIEASVNIKDRPEMLYRVEPSMCMKFFRKNFIKESGIEQYEGEMEDLSVSAALLCKAVRISQEPKALYNYRRCRQGSITGNIEALRSIFPALEALQKNLEKVDYVPLEQLYLFYRFFIYGTLNSYQCKDTQHTTEYEQLWRRGKEFLEKQRVHLDIQNSVSFFDKRVIVFGSYSLRKILNSVDFLLDTLIHHYTASSIISCMCKKSYSMEVRSNNLYRQQAVREDLEKSIAQDIKQIVFDYLIIDLLEERVGVVLIEDIYITASEYMKEAVDDINGQQISITDSEYLPIFYEKCDQFIDLLKQCMQPKKIILIRNLLTEEYGIYGKEHQYKDIHKIQTINNILNEMYDYFEKQYSGISVIYPETKWHYTDKDYQYGNYPYHYNSYYLCSMGEQLKKIIQSRELL